MRRGFTLIEAVLSLAIMSVVLLMIGAFIVQNQRIAMRNLLQNESVEDGRRSMLRLNEVISQAGYIYPNNQTITLPGNTTIVTGVGTLAVLVPWGSSYCQGASTQKAQYCAFLYTIEARSGYLSSLSAMSQVAGSVLVEKKYGWINWPTETIPTLDWTALNSQGSGVVTDGVSSADSALGNLTLVSSDGGLDSTVLQGTLVTDNDATIGAVRPKITISYMTGLKLSQEVDIAARTIPRIAEPGTGN